MEIPVEHVNLRQIRSQLTYKYQPMGEPVAVQVAGYVLRGDYICVPRQYGLKLCSQLQLRWTDATSEGLPMESPKQPTPRPYQEPVLNAIEAKFDDFYDVLFRAHTGWGKTIGSLIVAFRLGRTTLIVVDQDNLKEQWLEVLQEMFGLALEDIGIIQGNRCDYEGKPVSIAMVQTLTQRKYPEAFYAYFGTLIGDEVHTLGAPTFSQILLQFPAMYRLFVSATPKRGDGLQKALEHNCGPVRVAADKKHKESSVYIRRNPTVYSFYGNISPKVGRIISEVAEDGARNLMIAESALWLWESGRDTLVLSDRVEHLQHLQSMLIYMGVPAEEIGLYTGYEPVWIFGKDPTPDKRPADLHRWREEDGKMAFAPYSPVAMVQKDKKVPKAKFEQILAKCTIVLATYGKFQKGVDLARLAGGVDATPRAKAEQAQGRILRELLGKLKPIWVTVVDDNNYRLVHTFTGRIGEYLKSNSRLYEWDGQEGITEWNASELRRESTQRVADLKKMEIRESSSGGYELAPPSVKAKEKREEMRRRIEKVSARNQASSPNGDGSARLTRTRSVKRA